MISDNLQHQIVEAMKSGDTTRVSTLKLLSSSLHNLEIDKGREKLTEQEELDAVAFEAKKRKDAIEAYEKAGNQERANAERAELAILEEYLPEQLDRAEIEKAVSEAISATGASSPGDFGKVMGAAMGKLKGVADGNVVAEIVRGKLA